MLKTYVLRLDEIYVPVKRRKTLDPTKVEAIAESIAAPTLFRPAFLHSLDPKQT